MRTAPDLTSQRFGRLTVYFFAGWDRHGSALFLCVCDCGNDITVRGRTLRIGDQVSCGCKKREQKHGHALVNGRPTREYNSWTALRSRCSNPNDEHWPDYGGRGISVCERWQGEQGFVNFLADMGLRPAGMTIDRKNVNGNYEPDNCRWATNSEQQKNKRKNPKQLGHIPEVNRNGEAGNLTGSTEAHRNN